LDTATAHYGLRKIYIRIFGSPGMTWAFFIGWFERGGKKTELLE
jgi:hypothetical protein